MMKQNINFESPFVWYLWIFQLSQILHSFLLCKKVKWSHWVHPSCPSRYLAQDPDLSQFWLVVFHESGNNETLVAWFWNKGQPSTIPRSVKLKPWPLEQQWHSASGRLIPARRSNHKPFYNHHHFTSITSSDKQLKTIVVIIREGIWYK